MKPVRRLILSKTHAPRSILPVAIPKPMPTASPPSDLPTHAFPTTASFDAFLEREHASAPGIYLKLAKKASGIPSVTSAEAVEVALCYGWIDGRANGIDDKWWSVRYTPRRARSIWSQKNVGTVARLIEEGRMRPAGLAAVEAAKADGRWDRAYAGSACMVAPGDFTEALTAMPAAEAYFAGLNKTQRFEVLMPLATISDRNRAKKIDALVQGLAVGGKRKIAGAAREGKTLATSSRSAKIVKVEKSSSSSSRKTSRAQPPQTLNTLNVQTRREGLRRATGENLGK